MPSTLGQELSAFNEALHELHANVADDAVLESLLFAEADEWTDLLHYKLLPHLGGEGCLIIAAAGGTNTGKSTLFNLLIGKAASPVRATAAATRRPLIAAHPDRAEQVLQGKLTPEFSPRPYEDDDSVLSRETPEDALFVLEAESLPEQILLLDTPDVDSIDQSNWDVADHIRAAGDVLLAVLTGEKYRDDRVVAFFREARETGRLVIPVMNKANPAEDFAVAREQLDEFCADAGLEGPRFVIAHDFSIQERPDQEITCLEGGPPLREYLLQLDAASIKQEVYRETVRQFALRSGAFLVQARRVERILTGAAAEYDDRAGRHAERYEPVPGSEVGGLFHEFVQRERGAVRRWIGSASKNVVRGATVVGRSVQRAVRGRRDLETDVNPKTDAEIHRAQGEALERITRDLAATYFESASNLQEPAGHLVSRGLERLEPDEAVDAIVRQTLRSEHISEDFREHARKMLEKWWNDHRGRRHVVEALDAILAVTPAAIAVPIAIQTGPGLPEATLAIAGPVLEQFAARVFEYQFGDEMFDFLSPWKADQQREFLRALREHMTEPVLRDLNAVQELLQGPLLEQLEHSQQACLALAAGDAPLDAYANADEDVEAKGDSLEELDEKSDDAAEGFEPEKFAESDEDPPEDQTLEEFGESDHEAPDVQALEELDGLTEEPAGDKALEEFNEQNDPAEGDEHAGSGDVNEEDRSDVG